jgi:putative acetyltransferase
MNVRPESAGTDDQKTHMSTNTLKIEDPGTVEVGNLITQLDAYLHSLYPPECNHLMPIESLRQPNVTFLVARVDGQAVGCGAFVKHEAGYAELKRMFVLPDFRGLRLGRQILENLESLIRSAGLTRVCLETGVSQFPAVRLYESFGYKVRGPFGDYPDDPLSIFMEKTFASGQLAN